MSNFKLDDKGTFWISNFGANKTPVQVINDAFRWTSFRDIY